MKNRFRKTQFTTSFVYRPTILKFNRKSRRKGDTFKDVLESYLSEEGEIHFLPRNSQRKEEHRGE